METVTQDVKEELLSLARQIAIYQGHSDLVNGLQSARGLEGKYKGEWQEFREAVARKSWLRQLHEAADILYYAVQLEQQTGVSWLSAALASLHTSGFNANQVKKAALAKYGWRASAPGNKDETHELALICAALAYEEK